MSSKVDVGVFFTKKPFAIHRTRRVPEDGPSRLWMSYWGVKVVMVEEKG